MNQDFVVLVEGQYNKTLALYGTNYSRERHSECASNAPQMSGTLPNWFRCCSKEECSSVPFAQRWSGPVHAVSLSLPTSPPFFSVKTPRALQESERRVAQSQSLTWIDAQRWSTALQSPAFAPEAARFRRRIPWKGLPRVPTPVVA